LGRAGFRRCRYGPRDGRARDEEVVALRFFYGALAVLGLTAAGFAAGGFVAAEFALDRSAGFEAGTKVLMYGAVAALCGLIAAVLLLVRLRTAYMPRLALASVMLGVVAWGAVYLRFNAWHVVDKSVASFPAPVQLDTLPPTLPPPGTRDSLIALVAAPPELLARYETRETDYEQKALAVFGRHGAFYLVHANDGSVAWVRERDTGAAHPIEQLLINRLNYLTTSWDMRIRDDASMRAASRAVPIARTPDGEYPAKVLEFAHRADGVWLHIEVLSASPCDGRTPSVVTTGWIPLWGSDAKPTTWFHARGC
jgi:hypothetical protein